MSAQPCGCDPEAFWMCQFHRNGGTTPATTPTPNIYASLASQLTVTANSINDVLSDIPMFPRYDTWRLHWTRLEKAVEEATRRLQELQAYEANMIRLMAGLDDDH